MQSNSNDLLQRLLQVDDRGQGSLSGMAQREMLETFLTKRRADRTATRCEVFDGELCCLSCIIGWKIEDDQVGSESTRPNCAINDPSCHPERAQHERRPA